MQQLFVQGFVCTLRLLAGLAGALAALAVVLLAAWLIVRALGRLAAAAFDGATAALAKLWNRTGYKPKTKWGAGDRRRGANRWRAQRKKRF